MKLMLPVMAFFISVLCNAQNGGPSNQYRESSPKINELVHTRLDVRLDYDKQWLYGKEWITLQPHFYPTDSLALDAKGMDIKEISILKGNSKSPLQYRYDGMILFITLDKTYRPSDNYTLFIEYISKPND